MNGPSPIPSLMQRLPGCVDAHRTLVPVQIDPHAYGISRFGHGAHIEAIHEPGISRFLAHGLEAGLGSQPGILAAHPFDVNLGILVAAKLPRQGGDTFEIRVEVRGGEAPKLQEHPFGGSKPNIRPGKVRGQSVAFQRETYPARPAILRFQAQLDQLLGGDFLQSDGAKGDTLECCSHSLQYGQEEGLAQGWPLLRQGRQIDPRPSKALLLPHDEERNRTCPAQGLQGQRSRAPGIPDHRLRLRPSGGE